MFISVTAAARIELVKNFRIKLTLGRVRKANVTKKYILVFKKRWLKWDLLMLKM